MPRISLYRSLMFSVVAAAGILGFAGCDASSKKHETAKESATNQWNAARLAIIYQLAETQYKAGDYDKCKETLREAFSTKAKFAPMHLLSAKVHIEKGSLENAANDLAQAISINPSLPEPYYLMGVLNQRWQKPEIACDFYKQAWTKKGDEVRYMLAVVEMQITLGQLDEAQATLESRLAVFEQSPALRVALARIFSLKNDYATASGYYRDAVILAPEEPNIRRAYAESLFYAGKFSDSASVLEEIRKQPSLSDKGNVALMLGQCYLNLRRAREARNLFQEAIRENANDNVAYINLGKACLQTGDYQMTLSAAKTVLRIDPQNVQAMILQALVQQKQNSWRDAAVTLQNASRIAPNDSTILCMLGINARQQGKPDEAAGYFEKAVKANPNDAWATSLLGKRPASENAPAKPSDEPAMDSVSDTGAATATPVAVQAP